MPRVKLPPIYFQVLAEHRERHARVTEGGNLRVMKKIYDQAQGELERKLRKLTRQDRSSTFTAHQKRALLAQVRVGQAQVGRQMAGHLGVMSKDAQVEALRGLEKDITRLDMGFTGRPLQLPIAEASRFQKVVDGRSTSLLVQHETSMRNWGGDTVKAIEDQMTMSIATGETVDEAVSRIAETADTEWWRAERIVRSETAWAFNAVAKDGIEDAAQELPDLMAQWTEFVDPETGAPLDDRVAVDSLAIAQQVTTAGGFFVMPARSLVPDHKGRTDVPEALVGKKINVPPSRPNGREVVSPFRKAWGVPGWLWRDERRVWLVKR